MNEGQRGHQARAVNAGVYQRVPDIMAPQANPDSCASIGHALEGHSKQWHMKGPLWSTGEVQLVSVQQNAPLTDGAHRRTVLNHHESGHWQPPIALYPEQLFLRRVIDNKIGQPKQSIHRHCNEHALRIATRMLRSATPEDLASTIVNLSVALVRALKAVLAAFGRLRRAGMILLFFPQTQGDEISNVNIAGGVWQE